MAAALRLGYVTPKHLAYFAEPNKKEVIQFLKTQSDLMEQVKKGGKDMFEKASKNPKFQEKLNKDPKLNEWFQKYKKAAEKNAEGNTN